MKFNIFESFEPDPSTVLGERYVLMERLSMNGLEETFLGRDMHAPGHPDCIIKRFQWPEARSFRIETVRSLFEAAVEGRSRLSGHDCIPGLLAHFETEDEFHFVEEKVDGHSLAEELASPIPWSDQRVVALLNDLLSTLEYMHSRRVVHLNLQPSTLIRRRKGSRLTMIGFGSFHQVSARVLKPVASISTPPLFNTSLYMPDEQIAGHAQPNSDLYAVGAIAIQALTGSCLKSISIDPDTRELNWRSLASLRHPALLDLLDSLVRSNFRTRCQTASEALAALSALPPEITWFAPVAEPSVDRQLEADLPVLPAVPVGMRTSGARPVVAAAIATNSNPSSTAIQEVVQKQRISHQPAFRKAVLPVGGGILALLGISTLLVWRMPSPVAVLEGDRPESGRPSVVEEPPEDAQTSSTTEASTSGSPIVGSTNREEGAEGPVANRTGDDLEAAFEPQSEAIVSSELAAATDVNASESAIALAPEAAKATVDRFYDFVARRSWDSARSLLSDNMAQRLEPDFFDQFQDVSVENLRVISQTPEMADLTVQNTYVYLDGSFQQEERNYTVQMVGSQPKIVDTAFVEVIRDRGYGE